MFPYKVGRIVWEGWVKDDTGKDLSQQFLEALERVKAEHQNKALILLSYGSDPVYTIGYHPEMELYFIYLTKFPGKQVVDVFNETNNFRYFKNFLEIVDKEAGFKITRAQLVTVEIWQKDGKGFWGGDSSDNTKS